LEAPKDRREPRILALPALATACLSKAPRSYAEKAHNLSLVVFGHRSAQWQCGRPSFPRFCPSGPGLWLLVPVLTSFSCLILYISPKGNPVVRLPANTCHPANLTSLQNCGRIENGYAPRGSYVVRGSFNSEKKCLSPHPSERFDGLRCRAV
jgi:hypothetical protein